MFEVLVPILVVGMLIYLFFRDKRLIDESDLQGAAAELGVEEAVIAGIAAGTITIGSVSALDAIDGIDAVGEGAGLIDLA